MQENREDLFDNSDTAEISDTVNNESTQEFNENNASGVGVSESGSSVAAAGENATSGVGVSESGSSVAAAGENATLGVGVNESSSSVAAAGGNATSGVGVSESGSVVGGTVANEEIDEGNGPLEYATLPGSWASYRAEREREESYNRGNGVYPDFTEPYLRNGNESQNSDRGFSQNPPSYGEGGYGGYFGGRNGGYNGSSGYALPQKKISKKRISAYVGIVVLALAIAIFSAIGIVKRFKLMMESAGNQPSTGEQGGTQSGGTQNGTEGGASGGGQTGGTQNGSGTNVTPNAGSSSLQNGSFTLEQVPATEHYKLSDVYQLTESTVVAIKSSVGSGSGVIYSKDDKNNDGYFIVTNNHVIEGGENIKVTLSNGTVYDAVLVGRDENTDLAVLKVVATDLKVATAGISDDLRVAEEVLIIGNPLGTLGGTATNGIVSAKNRVITIDGYSMTLIQTNAAVNPGNSGGAMFNMAGQLVGIVNAKYAAEEIEGIGFAIPIDIAKGIIEDLTNYGYVKGRTNLGFKVTYGVKQMIDNYYSYWVTELNVGSDAEKAGLKLNDRIVSLSINGVSHSGENLDIDLNATKTGDVIVINVRRYTSSGMWIYYNDYEITITVTEYTGGNG